MNLEHFASLTILAGRIEEGTFDAEAGTVVLKLTEEEGAAVAISIAEIGLEIEKAHHYATETERKMLDDFVLAALAGGKEVTDAFRMAIEGMQTREKIITARVDAMGPKLPKQDA